ncbi:5-methyltetrahydropteroyltriglutamate--homocystein e methyltransferase [Carbonactinospora thermoautotrophica]|uniref:5-methyltetrahydropteroyltriglutamate--homocystein e methyltransferase n=1 Tax=Carbonactinospora thermoautotrophica TaxID=1469144 RepID=A0A132MMI2_9ACTN|nr:cobalamin-independent methionine synthase II family protein [Carbonactinospora thermoautotrophica]KWW99070.1 5-methyltetrahydropteroyltriglutamate--homocystein e methyltransferase [Carbonactinospora thermoautotrophica]
MRIKGEDVLLPTTMVGSYPRPNWLRGKVFGEFDEPDYIDYGTKEAYEDAVRLCVDDQIRAGFDVVCDGQQYFESETTHEYGQVFHFWGHRLAGFKRWGEPIAIELYKKFHAPMVVGDIEWVRPIFAPILEATRAAAGDRPVKLAMQGPLFLAFAVTDRYYGDPKSLAMAIARAFNKEFKDLTARGVDWIQIHEPLTYYGEEGWYLDVINTAFDGVDAYKVWHICYGNQGGNPGVQEPRGQDMFPFAFQANVDQIHIETMRRGPGDLPHLAKLPEHMDLGVGVIDVKSLVIERPEEIADRIVEAARYVPAERICVSTDCGLLNLKREHAQKKIQALVEGAALARERLSR